MEEPKKILRAQYLGCSEVQQAVGMNTINDAIEKIGAEAAPEHWTSVNVSISPSMIAVRPSGVSFSMGLPRGDLIAARNRFSLTKKNPLQDDDQIIVEARVRYLSFLGIGKNVKNCAFIVHTAQDKFVAHAFRCEPSSGALCKTIEAACKVRVADLEHSSQK
jgi:amyloid beta A4 precursor protein-binding family B member 2